jgi:phosphatidylinositol-4,5-bisphosphate 3-kinase
MAYVMGGIETEEFKLFKDLCCKAYNILRKNAQVFISLFAMVK